MAISPIITKGYVTSGQHLIVTKGYGVFGAPVPPVVLAEAICDVQREAVDTWTRRESVDTWIRRLE